jgi:glycosyltransferase involved in cell wall biosynthesis
MFSNKLFCDGYMSKTFKLHCLVCTYNDHVALPFTLDSVKDVVDSIIIADGAYQLYYDTYKSIDKNVKPYSTDGTLEIIKALAPDLPPIKILGCPKGKPWANQVVKRNALVDAVPVQDWFMVLDSDEMFFGDIEEGINEIMMSGCVAGRVPLYNVGLEMEGWLPFWHPRIFMKLPGMHYWRKHWLLCDGDNRVLEQQYPLWATDKFVLAHLKLFRNHRRIAPHLKYMDKLSTNGWIEPNEKHLGKPDEVVEAEELEVEVN